MRNTLFISSFFAVIVGLVLPGIGACDHGREIRPTSWQQDATVRDTFWIDADHGWAVGDQGLIIRTIDGGKTWLKSRGAGLDLDDGRSLEQKLSKMRPISRTHELVPLTCSFKSVFFLDRMRGWVAGNYYTPFLKTSRSVLLATDNGGKTWKQLKGSILPGINRIYFQQALGGWALGRAGHLFKTGVFATSSGGRSWTVQDSDTPGTWIDGELIGEGFIVIDDEGNLGRIAGGKYEAAVVFGDRPGRMTSVRMYDSKTGFAVGTAGTVLKTVDGGNSWRRPKKIDAQRLADFDFNSVSVVGDKVYFAGNPGTFVFEMDVEGGSGVQANATNFSLPISRVYFSNADHGCVVGANGLIATSQDGGQLWNVNRRVSDRVAVLAVTSNLTDLPLASLASFAGEQNRLVSSVMVGQHGALDLSLCESAMLRLGVSTHVPLRGDDLSDEDRTVDHDRLLSELVRTIRTLRPNVVVCGQVDGELEMLCRNAIEQASTDDLPEHAKHCGLNPWQVDRFMARRPAHSDLNFEVDRYLPRTGRLLEDQIAISLGELGRSPSEVQSEFFAVESYTGSVSTKGNDVFFALNQLGQVIPERTEATKLGNLNSIATAPLKHSEMQRLLQLGQGSDEQKLDAQSQIKNFGATQASRESGIWLIQLADKFLAVGEMEMAAFSLEKLVNRHADHPFAPACLMWLAQHYASDEVTATLFAKEEQRIQRQQARVAAETETSIETELADSEVMRASSIPVVGVNDGVAEVAWKPEAEAEIATAMQSYKTVQSWRIKMASRYLERLKQSDLDFAQSPDLQFMQASLSRKMPGDISNQNLLKKIKRSGDYETEYRSVASRELRLRDKDFRQQMPTSFLAMQRPNLDGSLDDEIWQNAIADGKAAFKTVVDPKTGQAIRTDVCWIANDDEFLFVAARCNRLNEAPVADVAAVRSRDPDLSKSDRIRIRIDFDRDLRSGFEFEIDSRGRAAESCCGSVGWNPNWFVAAKQDEDAWFVELAIPLKDLMVESIDERTVAAFSMARLNRDSVNCWNQAGSRWTNETAVKTNGILSGLSVDLGGYQLVRLAAVDGESDESSK